VTDVTDTPDAPLPDRLARAITLAGPMPVSQFMAAANAQYYATQEAIGAGGDFVTAPEISQMFGELIGLWCADLWDRAGRPAAAWVELGPGRGTLAADARRASNRPFISSRPARGCARCRPPRCRVRPSTIRSTACRRPKP
jgi:NADH dehydrogenase [ubiquinone] 1 alpha subcomplex assembly factor 7